MSAVFITLKLADVKALIASHIRDEIIRVPPLKFGVCLPSPLDGEVSSARFNDPEAIANIRREPIREVVGG